MKGQLWGGRGVLTRIVEEERIVGLGVLDQPLHRAQDIVFGGLQDGVGLVVGQDDHVLTLVVVAVHQERRDILDIVDAALELVGGAKVVDADQQGLALSGALTVLEGIICGCAVAELLLALRHAGGWAATISAAAAVLLLGRRVVLLGRGVLLVLGRVMLLWRRILLLWRRVLLLLRRVLLLMQRVLLLLRRVVGVVGLRRALMIAVALLWWRGTPLARRRALTVPGAVALSWIHSRVGCCGRGVFGTTGSGGSK